MATQSNADPVKTTSETRYVVTFVHGTWGSKSSFLQEDSPLQEALRENTKGISVATFRWSGSNSVSARLRAATKLGRHIKKLGNMHPDARHFIVAHSHGGNVALYSLKDPLVNSVVDGIVCFSTPFINVSWRNDNATELYSTALKTLIAIPLMPIFAGILIGIMLLFMQIKPLVDFFINISEFLANMIDVSDIGVMWVPIVAAGVALLCALVAGLVFVPVILVSPILERWFDLAKRHERALSVPSIEENRLLVIRTSADEASRAIAFSGFITWMTSLTYEVFFKFALTPFNLVSARFSKVDSALEVLFIGVALIISIALMLLGSVLVSIPLLILLILAGLTGLSHPSTSIFLLVSAESSPHGSHRIHLYNSEQDPGRLAHSASYSHQPAVDRAVRWILRPDDMNVTSR